MGTETVSLCAVGGGGWEGALGFRQPHDRQSPRLEEPAGPRR